MNFFNQADIPMLPPQNFAEINAEMTKAQSMAAQRDANHDGHNYSVAGARGELFGEFKGDGMVGQTAANTSTLWEDLTQLQIDIISAMTGRVPFPDNFPDILKKCEGPRMQTDGSNAFNGTYRELGFLGADGILPFGDIVDPITNEARRVIVLAKTA